MKIPKHILQHMKEEIDKLSDRTVIELVRISHTDPRVKVPAVRFRWDLYWATNLNDRFSTDNEYRQFNSDHIDTALRSIVKEGRYEKYQRDWVQN